MAGPSSYSVVDADAEEVVLLGEAADLDPATHTKFFSDGDAASVELSWPEAEAIVSTLSGEEISALCHKYRVPNNVYRPCFAGDLASSTTQAAGSRAVCVYAAALAAGMRFPLHDLYVKVLNHYRLAPGQLTPNSWAYMAAFVRLCEDAGVDPLVSVFRYFFIISAHKNKGSQSPSGWHHIQPFTRGARRRLFTGGNLLSYWSGWKARFFFLQASSSPVAKSWKCPMKWGKPRRADVRPPQDAVDAAIRRLLEQAGETGVDLTTFLSQRGFPAGTHDSDLFELPAATVKREARVVAAAGTGTSASATASTGNKRKSPEEPVTPPGFPAATTFAATSTPPTAPGLTAGLKLPGSDSGTFGAQGSYSELSALQSWNTITAGENDKTQLQDALRAANAEVAKLRRELQEAKDMATRLNKDQALLMDHLTATVAKNNQLEEDHAAAMARVRDAAAKEVRDAEVRAKKKAVLALFPNLDPTLLELSKLD